jgi:hypothetical protein
LHAIGCSLTVVFQVCKLGGSGVMLPLTIAGDFGIWQTFVGGGPDAW